MTGKMRMNVVPWLGGCERNELQLRTLFAGLLGEELGVLMGQRDLYPLLEL